MKNKLTNITKNTALTSADKKGTAANKNDATLYTDKLPSSLNSLLKNFAGNECVMVRYAKEKGKQKARSGNCHLNVQACVDSGGGKAISGWILNRDIRLNENGLYVWSFHSVWEKPDGKWVDVTEDKHYTGRDKSIFVPDSNRTPNLVDGLSYNNFMAFTEPKFAAYFGSFIGEPLLANKIYWTDTVMMRVMDEEQHSGVYRLIGPNYPDNVRRMCDEYEMEIVDGKPAPKPGSKYADAGSFPMKVLFDYSLSSRG